MKNKQPIRNLLGVSQLEAAMLLGIHRSQWSMFESGKRDLPLAAQQLLAEMLSFVQGALPQANRLKQISAKQAQDIEQKLQEMAYQQLRLERKISKIEQEHQWQLRRELLQEFLSQRQGNKSLRDAAKSLLPSRNKATEALSLEMAQCHHRKELLELERLLLESQLIQWNKTKS